MKAPGDGAPASDAAAANQPQTNATSDAAEIAQRRAAGAYGQSPGASSVSPSSRAPRDVEADATSEVLSGGADPDPEELWGRVHDAAGAQLQALLGSIKVQRVGQDSVRLLVTDAAHIDFARKKAEQLQRLIGEALSRSVRVEIAAVEAAPRRQAGSDDVADAMSHPLVRDAVELFDASIVHVEKTDRDS